MFKKLATFLAGAALILATSNAMANAINDNRPYSDTSLSNLQDIFNDNLTNYSYDAVSSQSNAALWKQSDAGGAAAFAVAAARGNAGELYIYSATTGDSVLLMSNPGTDDVSQFYIKNNGNLSYDGTTYIGFGKTFGFYWVNKVTGNISYTEDSENDYTGTGANNNIKALTYLIQDGTGFKDGSTLYDYFGDELARNNDDWIIAFEDLNSKQGSDFDFDDAVFYVKDISAVPEPGTMVLLGAGMLGLAIFGKRRMNRES